MHVIESIYRDELNAGDLINQDSFDTVAQKRDLWKCAGGQWGGGKSAKSIINEISQQFGIRIFHNHKDIVYANTFDWWDDVASKNVVKTFDKHNIEKRSIDLGKTPLDKVYNEFEVWYCYSFAWRKFRFRHYCTQTKDSHTSEDLYPYAANANTNYFNGGSAPHILSVNATWMNDKDTGERYLRYLVRKYSKQWYTITFKAYYDGAITLTQGDCIRIIHDELPSEVNGKKWEVGRIRFDRDSHTYTIEAICAESP